MKTTAAKNNTESTSSSQPFFSKGGENSFISNGNKKSNPFFTGNGIQASLTVGQPDDPFEKEADKVSRQVVDGFDQVNSIQRKLSTFGLQQFIIQPFIIGSRISRKMQKTLSRTPVVVQAKCPGCEEEEKMQQKSGDIQFAGDGSPVPSDIESRIHSMRGGGQGMNAITKTAMEGSFGADFSGVRVHTSSEAVQMSQQLNAHAFTVGNDIFFNKGRYQPQSKQGAGLLAHELTHTIQQGASVQSKRISNQSLFSSLSAHSAAHLSAINGSDSTSLSRKEIAQLEKLPEEEMKKMQQLQMLQMKGVDKVQKKNSGLSLRMCNKKAPAKKTISLHINHLEKGPTSHTTDLQKALDTYKAANVDFNVVKNETFNDAETKLILGTDYILDEYSSVGTPTAEETKLLAAPKGVTAGAISMYYVKGLSAGSTGESFWTKDWPGVNPSVVISSVDTNLTFSHELGHVLLNDGGHHPDPDNLMFNFNQKFELDSTQKTKIYNSPFAK